MLLNNEQFSRLCCMVAMARKAGFQCLFFFRMSDGTTMFSTKREEFKDIEPYHVLHIQEGDFPTDMFDGEVGNRAFINLWLGQKNSPDLSMELIQYLRYKLGPEPRNVDLVVGRDHGQVFCIFSTEDARAIQYALDCEDTFPNNPEVWQAIKAGEATPVALVRVGDTVEFLVGTLGLWKKYADFMRPDRQFSETGLGVYGGLDFQKGEHAIVAWVQGRWFGTTAEPYKYAPTWLVKKATVE